jgi:hypothetical protein
MHKRLLSLLIALVWLAGLLLVARGDDDGGENSGEQNADVTISSIALDPAQPTADESFTITVKVKNQGRAESGSYAVTVARRDVT